MNGELRERERQLTANSAASGPYQHLGIIGAGAWGTALALAAARAGRQVTLWAGDAALAQSITATRQNEKYLPEVALPDSVHATGDQARAVSADTILLVVPAQHVRAILSAFAPTLPKHVPVVVCAKGIERSSGKLMDEVLAEFLGASQIAILSGPSFARDVAAGLPTAVTVAAQLPVANRLQIALAHGAFRPYASDDVVGVALGGAAKNVYAIACGIVDGMGLGESARAGLLARSFAELRRLGEALGARGETLMGLSGLGDLVLTATSQTSRNFSYGVMIGKGRSRTELEAKGHPLAEGVATAAALVARARREGVELPVAEAAAAILEGALPLDTAMPLMMNRPLKAE